MYQNKKFKIDLIIQARMGSKRLPGKSLMHLNGEPLVGRIIERVKRCKNISQIILAIPNNDENKKLKSLGNKYGVSVFLGSENNVLDRYYRAAKKYNSDFICRLPADNATPEPAEIDKIINFHINSNASGFSTNLSEIQNSGYPDGIGVEIFSFCLLEKAAKECSSAEKKEHIHLNFYDYKNDKPVDELNCPVKTLECPDVFRRPDLVLDINTKEQYEFMNSLYTYLYPSNPKFTILDIINWYDNVYLKNT